MPVVYDGAIVLVRKYVRISSKNWIRAHLQVEPSGVGSVIVRCGLNQPQHYSHMQLECIGIVG